MNREKSREWFTRAEAVMAGGVNSPARSFRAVGDHPPIVMRQGQGAYFTDVDGNRYLDYLAAFGPLILGHAHPRVTERISEAARNGSLLGTPSPFEIELAETLVQTVEGLEMVRMTTTGTEAVMSAIRLARAYTGRPMVVKFEGAYHGHSDPVLVVAGSGASTVGTGDSLGIPPAVTGDILSVPFNDIAQLAEVMARYGDRVACILTEPIVGNMGIVAPHPGYLDAMKEMAHRFGALLIFDEVITAFRFHYGSAGSMLGVIPDLYALGKLIGGGLPAGAYGGRREIMEYVAPLGGMFQAGTFAGNPLSCAAGLETLRALREENPYSVMAERAERLAGGIEAMAATFGIPLTINRVGSAFTVFFGRTPVVDFDTAQKANPEQFGFFHREMMKRGVYLAPSRFEAWFVSAVHTDDDIAWTLDQVEHVFRLMGQKMSDVI